ncbi:hypothetical protein AVEN_53903-1 [Araneus ventricosus]|uniref:Uncharacterized protein n=1 Tax=Araneus ventricosus TaxID=182803 RepID=A0A4Y2IED4_ARAVE|nr:hypothetical protein AVEN_53903-1 [Araneus ventricosus]
MKSLKKQNNLVLTRFLRRQGRGRRKDFLTKKCEDESSEISQHKKFKVPLLQVNDRIEAELDGRFQSMQKVNEVFGYLSPKQLTTLDYKTLREKATTLENLYRDDLDKDDLLK